MKFSVLCLLLTTLFATLSGAAAGKELSEWSGKIPPKLRRLSEDIEDFDKKKNEIGEKSKKAINQAHIRAKMALQFLQEGQKFILKAKPDDGRIGKILMIMKNEQQFLESVIKNLPGLKEMTDVKAMLKAIRAGKIRFNRKISKNDRNLLEDFHKFQRDALDEYFEKELRNFSR